jgi:alcohol dehydrogenase (cytochrome c)
MDSTVVSAPYIKGRAYAGVTFTTKRAPGYEYVGEFVAFDPVKGERKWAYKAPSGAAMVAGALATAGGVVFGGTADRQFFALNTDTGELLWQTRLNGDVSGAPISFEVGGRQYIAITAGGRAGPTTSFGPLTNSFLPAGSGSVYVFALPPAREPQISTLVPTRPALIARSGDPAGGKNLTGSIFDSTDLFVANQAADAAAAAAAKAGGKPAPSATQASAAVAASPLNGVFSAAQAARGAVVFQRQCGSCHAPEDHAGASFKAKWGGGTVADMYRTISTTMPQGNAGGLSPQEYASIVALYLRQTGFTAGQQDLPSDPTALAKLPVGN